MRERISQVSARAVWAGVLTFFSIFVLIVLAYRSSSTHPPNGSEAVLLTVLSAFSQLGSTFVSGWHTESKCDQAHADPYFVKSAVARIVSIGIQVQDAERQAQKAMESGNTQGNRAALGTLSVMMSVLQEQILAAAEDWNNLAPDSVKHLIQEGHQASAEASTPREVSHA